MRSSCPEACRSCFGLGYLKASDRTDDEFHHSLEKARSGEYQAVFFPCNLVFERKLDQWIRQTLESGLEVLLQISPKSLNQEMAVYYQDLLNDPRVHLLFHLDSHDFLQASVIENLAKKYPRCFFHLILNHYMTEEKIKKSFNSELRKKLYFTAPYKGFKRDCFYSCKELFELTRRNPELYFQTIQGLDLYDPRISDVLDLESLLKPVMRSEPNNDQLKISVVIPTYNNEIYILNTLRHLAHQSLPQDRYEVIIVNDGSDDGSDEKIKNYLSQSFFKNYIYLYSPRPKKREMGDAQFRAGVTRNLGAKWASSPVLSFLDADMIVPADYLSIVLDEVEHYDLVQPRRDFLKKEISSESLSYHEIDPKNDTFIPEGGYWHQFYQKAENWNEHKAPWKYVCTYGLSLKRDLFYNIGRFRKSYMFYGFEDTDLGYRLYKIKKTFHLSRAIIFHLNQREERSEYSNSQFLRNILLSKTGRIFFRHYLNSEIYQELKFLIQDGSLLEKILIFFRRLKVTRNKN